MKRPYMDDFLTKAYQHYDLVVWSQTSWRVSTIFDITGIFEPMCLRLQSKL